MSLPGLQKMLQEGERSVYVTSEDALRRSSLVRRKSTDSTKADSDRDSEKPKKPVSKVVGWVKRVNGVKMDIGRRLVDAKVLGSPENPKSAKSETTALDSINKNFQQIHPVNVMNEQVKDKLKTTAKQNAKRIAVAIVELGFYTAAFHHTKQGLKYVTRKRTLDPL